VVDPSNTVAKTAVRHAQVARQSRASRALVCWTLWQSPTDRMRVISAIAHMQIAIGLV
jgi:hypothetical protein